MHSHHFPNHDANIRHWECERKGEKRAKDQEGFSFVVGVTWTFDPTLGIIWKQTKAQITSLNFRLKIKTSKVPIAFFSDLQKQKPIISFDCYYNSDLQRKLTGQSPFHCKPDKYASSNGGGKSLTPADRLFSSFKTWKERQSLLSK